MHRPRKENAGIAAAELMVDGLVSVVEAARLLGMSRSFLYAAMERGELPYAKLGRSRRLPLRAVFAYAAKHMRGGTAGSAP
jgi:excisionase family DNA binding protein